MRMLEEAERLSPFLKLQTRRCDLRLAPGPGDLEESERSPFGLVAIEEGAESEREPTSAGLMVGRGQRSFTLGDCTTLPRPDRGLGA